MIDILKNIYLPDNKNVKQGIDKLWNQYQYIINKKKPSWTEVNKARAILYTIGHIIPEIIALDSLEKRIKFIKPKISLDKFLKAVDGNDKKILNIFNKNTNFNKLKEFYIIIKSIKNKVNKGKLYLDEDIFNLQYNKVRPKNYF